MNLPKSLLLLSVLGIAAESNAIVYQYDMLNEEKKTCRMISWSGSQPASGKLTLPSIYKAEDGTEYTVVRVADNALNNLTEVTDITIPACYEEIGTLDDLNVFTAYLNNFNNCPKLTAFHVAEGSKSFQTSPAGILFIKGGEYLTKVPAQLNVTGKYAVPKGCNFISGDAFAGNATITHLVIHDDVRIHENGGINRMSQLATIELTRGEGKAVLSLNEGMLIEEETNYYYGTLYKGPVVVASAPKGSITKAVVPDGVLEINPYAFYNCKNISSVKIPESVVSFGDRAFSRSGITSIKFPSKIINWGKELLTSCKELKGIAITHPDATLEAHFAANCPNLIKVTTASVLKELREGAFKSCTSLTTFPFNAQTRMSADSIFYNCGFEKIEYQRSKMAFFHAGKSMFQNCKKLKELDFSNIIPSDLSPGMIVGAYFTDGCINLKKVNLGSNISFWGINGATSKAPAFGYNCAIDTIAIGRTYGSDFAEFIYSPIFSTTARPVIYGMLTRCYRWTDNWNVFNIGNLFEGSNGANVKPVIMCDAFQIADPNEYAAASYVLPGATYYVPGMTKENYYLAIEAGNTVREMFDVSFHKVSATKLEVSITPKTGNGYPKISNFHAFDSAEREVLPDANGVATVFLQDSSSHVIVAYSVDGYPFETLYPSSCWNQSGIETIETEENSSSAPRFYNLQGVEVTNPSSGVYIKIENGKSKKVIL